MESSSSHYIFHVIVASAENDFFLNFSVEINQISVFQFFFTMPIISSDYLNNSIRFSRAYKSFVNKNSRKNNKNKKKRSNFSLWKKYFALTREKI